MGAGAGKQAGLTGKNDEYTKEQRSLDRFGRRPIVLAEVHSGTARKDLLEDEKSGEVRARCRGCVKSELEILAIDRAAQ